jgi:hypothetical protein
MLCTQEKQFSPENFKIAVCNIGPRRNDFFHFFVKKTSHLNFTTHHWALSLHRGTSLFVCGGRGDFLFTFLDPICSSFLHLRPRLPLSNKPPPLFF